jgi:multiple sugar transport system permease protein
MIELVNMSLTKTDFITTEFVGLDNYLAIFEDQAFITSGINSIFYTILMIIGEVGGAVFLALVTCRLSKKWQDFSRIIFYLPVLSAGLIISQSWKWLFNFNGLIIWLLGFLGINPISWFSQPETAIPAISIIISFSSIGGYLIILLSSILTISKDIFDAAQLDGASWLQIKMKIIFPIICPSIGLCILLTVIAAPQVFETILAMAPYDYTATMTYEIFFEAFTMSRHGSAAAMSIILTIIVAGLSLLKNRLSHE